MKRLFIIFIVACLFSCSEKGNGDKSVSERLGSWDKALIKDPYKILDSLKNQDIRTYSNENRAYYFLLGSIVRERCGIEEKDDSTIIQSEKWYKSQKDYYNLCRATLYKGIIRYNQYEKDTLTRVYILNAKNMMSRYEIDDPMTTSTLYKYMGKLKKSNFEYKEAEEYFKMSRKISLDIGDSAEVRRLDLEIFYINLSQKDYSQALAHIAQYIDEDTVHPEKAYELNEAVSLFFMVRNEFDIAIVYLRNMLALSERTDLKKIDKASLYHRFALYYSNKEVLDSAILYSQLALKSVSDSTYTKKHDYYKFLATLYERKGDTHEALNNYKKAYESYVQSYSRLTNKNVGKIENLYDSSVKEAEIIKEKNNRRFFTLLGLFAIMTLSGATILLRKKVVDYKKVSHQANNEKKKVEEEVNKMRFVNELSEVSVGLLHQLMQNVSIEADRSRSGATDTAARLDKCITLSKKTTKEKYAGIVQRNFIANYPNMEYISNLTDFEKVVFILLDNGYSVKQIAMLLDRTQSCISGEKSKIKDKILSRPDLPFDPREKFSIFN